MRSDPVARELRLRHGRSSNAVRHWCARAATGSSVIRVFASDTKPPLLQGLVVVPVEEMAGLRTREEFESWFEARLHEVAETLQEKNRLNSRVQPGLTWGHTAKVLAIYIRAIVLHSRFFPDDIVARVKPWLFVPVDNIVIKRLETCGVRTPFRKIREIASRADFYFVQNLLAERCDAGIARVVFDDGWADREESAAQQALQPTSRARGVHRKSKHKPRVARG